MQLKTLDIQDESIDLLVLKVKFDQAIKLHSINASAHMDMMLTEFQSFSNDNNNNNNNNNSNNNNNNNNQMPAIITSGGFVTFHCADRTASSAPSGNNNGPPSFLMVLPPTTEPAVSFLTLMQGQVLDEIWFNDTIAAGLILNDNQGPLQNYVFSRDYTKLLGCASLEFLNTSATLSPFVVAAEANDQVFSDNIVFDEFTETPCELEGLNQFLLDYDTYIQSLANVTSQKELNKLQFRQGAISARDVWSSCLNKINNFFVMEEISVPVTNAIGCFEQDANSIEFQSDPCCNRTLLSTQCCLPKENLSRTIQKPVEFKENMLAQCQHPDEIKYVLESFSNTYQRIKQAELSDNNGQNMDQTLWTTYTSFVSKCSNIVFNQVCRLDTDCKYSKSCNSNNGICNVNWDDQDSYMIKCFIDEMPSEVLFELGSLWKVPYFLDPIQQAQAFEPEFTSRILSNDCVGPKSNNFRSKSIYNDQTQTYIQVPGNQTGCIAEKSCNWNSWEITNEQDCVGEQVIQLRGSNLCGLFDGSQYRDFSRQPVCTLAQAHTQSACLNRNGTWITDHGWNYCLYPTSLGVTRDQCLTGSLCAKTNSNSNTDTNSWLCSSDVCYNDTLSQEQCNNLRQQFQNDPIYGSFVNNLWWNPDVNACIRLANWNPDGTVELLNITTCNFFNFTYQLGRWYNEGQWYNQQECGKGVCSVPSLQQQPVTAEICAQAPACNQPCSRCESRMKDQYGNDLGICYSTNFTTFQACQLPEASSSGVLASWDQQMLVCVYKTANSPTQCANISMTSYYTCNDIANTPDQCSNAFSTSTIAQYLQCNWNTYAACISPQQCESSGRCNDDDLIQWSPQGGNSILGSCLLPTEYDIQGNKKWCQDPNRQTRAGCVSSSIKNETDCLQQSPLNKWLNKSTTQGECVSHKQGCYFGYDTWNFKEMNADTCSSCDGNFHSVYQWKTGSVLPTSILPTVWVPRAWTSINQWKPTLDFQKLNDNVLNLVITLMVARNAKNQQYQKYDALIPIMKAIVCDCFTTSNNNAVCLQDLKTSVIDMECRNDPGTVNVCGPFLVNMTSLNNQSNSTSTYMTVVRTLSGPFVVKSTQSNNNNNNNNSTNVANRRLFSSLSSSSGSGYSIVQNYNKTIVGQIVGDGLYYYNNNNSLQMSNVQLCLTRSMVIDISNSDFQVADLIVSHDNVTISSPLNAHVTQQGLDFCTFINNTGLYFPILRVSNWTNYAGSLSPSSSSSSSSSTIIIIVAIVVGVIVALFLIWFFILRKNHKIIINPSSRFSRRR